MAGVPVPPGGMPSPYLDVQWTSSPTTNYEINSVDAIQRQMEQVQAMQAPKDAFGHVGTPKPTGEHAQGNEAAPKKRKPHDNNWWNGIKNTLLGLSGGFILGKVAQGIMINRAYHSQATIGVIERFGGRIGTGIGIGIGILASIFGL